MGSREAQQDQGVIDHVKQGIIQILENYHKYSCGAARLFNDCIL